MEGGGCSSELVKTNEILKMGKHTVTVLTCDICGRSSRSREDTKKWLEWSQDDLMVDRMWHDRCACPTCVNDIQVALKNRK